MYFYAGISDGADLDIRLIIIGIVVFLLRYGNRFRSGSCGGKATRLFQHSVLRPCACANSRGLSASRSLVSRMRGAARQSARCFGGGPCVWGLAGVCRSSGSERTAGCQPVPLCGWQGVGGSLAAKLQQFGSQGVLSGLQSEIQCVCEQKIGNAVRGREVHGSVYSFSEFHLLCGIAWRQHDSFPIYFFLFFLTENLILYEKMLWSTWAKQFILFPSRNIFIFSLIYF